MPFTFLTVHLHCFPQSHKADKSNSSHPVKHPAGSDLLTCRRLRLQPCSCCKQRTQPGNRTASMAAKYFYRQGFLLLLFNFISTAALEKRFSDLKRCADEECSSKFTGLLTRSSPGLQGCIFPHPPLFPAASHKLRLISKPVASQYLRPGLSCVGFRCCSDVWPLLKSREVNIDTRH